MKECFKCGKVKELDQFYKHGNIETLRKYNPRADGHLNKCKLCTKLDVTKYRYKNLRKIQAYEKLRAALPSRVMARKEYASRHEVKIKSLIYSAKWITKNPEKRAATVKKYNDANKEKRSASAKVSRAIKMKKLVRLPCSVCGNKKSHAHHDDYSKPLDVIWVCSQHHKDIHSELRNLG